MADAADVHRHGPAPHSTSLTIDRAIALHKMIRLFTISLAGQAYLNFMGNEFGHPEWIDFPREGNGWSYAHARRLWSLAENGFLRYSYLGAFDRAMLKLVRKYDILGSGYAYNHLMDTANQTLAFSHGTTVFVFNWHPSEQYSRLCDPGSGTGPLPDRTDFRRSRIRRLRPDRPGCESVQFFADRQRRQYAAIHPHLQPVPVGPRADQNESLNESN